MVVARAFDALARAIGAALPVPGALISVVSSSGQEVVGVHPSELPTVHATALCRQVVLTGKPVIDVAGYAGVPIVERGAVVGAVAALDRRVRAWSERDVEVLRHFADVVAALERERRLTAMLLRAAEATTLRQLLDELAGYTGWPYAEIVTSEHGRVRDHAGTALAFAIPDSSAVLELFTEDASADSTDITRVARAVAALAGSVLARQIPHADSDRRTGELEALALHDELTGLLNRRGFYAVAGGQLAIARRKAMPGIVLFIDLDGLKDVNDRDGHSAGDALLRLAAGVLRSTFRESDTIARVGGDEFVVFSIDATDQDLAAVTERLATELAEANALLALSASLRWSVGFSAFVGDGSETLEALTTQADRRMYEIKRSRRVLAGG